MVYTVSQISNEIKDILTTNIPDKITIEGEISNLKISNNNLFFTLKDEDSAISIASWSYEKYFNIDNLSNGVKVQVSGKLSCYSKNGTYSMHIYKLEKHGIGNLHTAYQKLKDEFTSKGYFDDKNKKQLPENIQNIGIITSPEGAALQDILFVLKKNKFQGKVYIKRCMVQGAMCPKSIVDSIKYINKFRVQEDDQLKYLDLIMISRGGGSFEDLMGYSDAKVVEAIRESQIYIMSAVGHEVDFMLSDYVADCRAPTPSIGAEIITKNQKDILDKLDNITEFFTETLKTKILHSIEIYHNRLNMLQFKNISPIEIITSKIKELDNLKDVFDNYLEKSIANYFIKINNLEKDLEKYNIEKINNFGMVQVYIKNNDNYEICNSIKFLEANSKKQKTIKLVFDDGIAEFTIKKIDIKTNNN